MIIDGITDAAGTGLKDGLIEGADLVSGGFGGSYAKIAHTEANGGHGGAAVSGWNDRILNTKVDPDNIVTLSSNQFTLQAGTYEIECYVPGYRVQLHQAILYNVTDAQNEIYGSSERCDVVSVSGNTSRIFGIVDISVPTTYRLIHWCQDAKVTNGLGTGNVSNGQIEVFTQIIIRKRA